MNWKDDNLLSHKKLLHIPVPNRNLQLKYFCLWKGILENKFVKHSSIRTIIQYNKKKYIFREWKTTFHVEKFLKVP
jgi:hypothetical protein